MNTVHLKLANQKISLGAAIAVGDRMFLEMLYFDLPR